MPFPVIPTDAGSRRVKPSSRVRSQLPELFTGDARFDAAYFSGSLTLMPDPPAALRAAASMLKESGRVYVTQTFQNRRSRCVTSL